MESSHVQAVRQARETLQNARRGYHLALVIATDAGIDVEQIADALGTRAVYIEHTLRDHRAGVCGCAPIATVSA